MLMTSSRSLTGSFRALSLLVPLVGLVLAGCDKLPLDKGEESSALSTPSAPPPDAATLPGEAAAAAGAPVTPPPPPPTPQQVVDKFLETPPQQRTNDDLERLAGLPEGLEKIVELDLHDSAVTDHGTRHLPNLPAVTSLNIAGTRISGAGLAPVAELSTLETLVIDRIPTEDDGFTHVGALTGLRELSANGLSISDQGVLALKDLNNLEVLRLGNNTRLLGKEFSALVAQGAFPHLRVLHVSGSGFGYYGLTDVSRIKSLEELHVGSCEVGDGALPMIAKCAGLRVLGLGNNRLTDAGLRELTKLKNLEELDLGGNVGITDAGLQALRTEKQLKRLSIEGTRCTPEVAQQLKDKFLKETTIHINGVDL